MNKKVEWDIIVPIKLPISLKNVEPGKLHPSLLREIPQGGKLHYLAADAWNAMVDAAKADGIELKPTSSGDTYRSYDSQKAGFLQRYQLEPVANQSTKTFEGKTWYLKRGMAMMATPGKSNHNLGLAVDIHSASEKKRLDWLIKNVLKFGWSWEVVPSEPWHLRYVCGDNPPPAVVAFTSGQPAAAAPVASSTAAASAGDEKKKLQEALKEKGFYNGPIDGNIATEETQQAIKNFKLKNGLNADFVVGPKVKELLGLK